jgi:hypothetical protein
MTALKMTEALNATYTRPAELPSLERPAANDDAAPRRFYWAKEARQFPPPRWLVHGLLPAGGLALLYGESSSGKSTLAVDLGMRIATGMQVQGSVCERGIVMHVAGEDETGLRQRITAFCMRNDVHDPAYAILPGRLDLASPGSVDDLIADIKAAKGERGEPVMLVIVDTLARCASIEENSSSDMGIAVAACDRIRHETGATVLLIHHSGKEPKKGARGSSALRAAVDAEIEVQSIKEGRGLWVTKQRNGRAQYGWQFTLNEVEVHKDATTGWSETACTVEHLGKTDGPLFGKSTGKRMRFGSNQKKLRDALEKAYRDGVDSWTQDEFRELARVTFPAATRSTIHSAMDGMTKHAVLAGPVEGRLWLVKPPKRAAVPASMGRVDDLPARSTQM